MGVQEILSHQYLTWSLPSPLQELKADGEATPRKDGFFERLQLPQNLRAFKVSSPHLAAYMGTGGCWTLWKHLSHETSLQAFYITADSISVSFCMLSK